MEKIIQKVENRKFILFSIFMGFVIHGSMLFKKMSWHDDIASLAGFGSGQAMTHGRWFYAILAFLMNKLIGIEGVPVVMALILFVSLGVSALILFKYMNVNADVLKYGIIILMISHVTVLGNFGYIGTAGINSIGILVSIIAGVLAHFSIRERKVLWGGIAAILLAISLGIYQCYISIFLSLVVILLLGELILSKNISWKQFWLDSFGYVFISICGIVLYVIATILLCKISGIELTSYAGTSSFGVVPIEEYFNRICIAYKEFFIPSSSVKYSSFPFEWGGWRIITILSVILSTLICLIYLCKKRIIGAIQYLIVFSLFPLAMNFIFVLYDVDSVHSLHVFQTIFYVFYVFYMLDCCVKTFKFDVGKKLEILLTVFVFLISFANIKYDNFCYMQAEIMNERATNYLNRLVCRIQETKGYEAGMPVVFINPEEFGNQGENYIFSEQTIVTNPYNYTVLGYTWQSYLKTWVAKDFDVLDDVEKLDSIDTTDMNAYPSSDSIKIQNGIVVVNFGE